MSVLNPRVAAHRLPPLVQKYLASRAEYELGKALDGPYDVSDELCDRYAEAEAALAEAMRAAGVRAVRHGGGLVISEAESHMLEYVKPAEVTG